MASLGDSDMWFVKFAPPQFAGIAPMLTQVPTNTTAVVGASATFSVTAANATGYVWRHNGNVIPGATTATLSLSNLQLTNAGVYSVTATNATGSVASPDFSLIVFQDTDGDGLPDAWETTNGTNPAVADANADPDADGLTNHQEYLIGTNPNDRTSTLAMGHFKDDCGNLIYGMNASANVRYTIEFTSALGSGVWTRVMDVFAAPTNRVVSLPVDPRGVQGRYYRILATVGP